MNMGEADKDLAIGILAVILAPVWIPIMIIVLALLVIGQFGAIVRREWRSARAKT